MAKPTWFVRAAVLAVGACGWGTMGPSACVGSVTVSPPAVTVPVGQTAQLYATVRDTAGNVLNGEGVTWASDSPAVATVRSTGLVTGVAVGQTAVTATSEGQSGRATVTVTAAPVSTGARDR